MEFQIIWFVLWGVLWAVYFMLDGFDLGTGILSPYLGRSESEKRQVLTTIGPFWNGNEVWLITAGGATFAAFPTAYALMFSYLYLALLIILFALIFRGVALEFRVKVDHPSWRKWCDLAIFLGSLLPAILFGVAFGNIFQGLPMNADGYHGSLLSLLNPFGVLTGIFFLLMFLVHGALYISLRTGREIAGRASALAGWLWYFLFAVAACFLAFSYSATMLYDNYFKVPVLFLFPLCAVFSLVCIRIFLWKHHYGIAFTASCLTILAVTATGIAGLYPNLIPSSLDQSYSLTIFNSSSSVYTLRIMTAIAVVFVPIVIMYQIWTYRFLSSKMYLEETSHHKESY